MACGVAQPSAAGVGRGARPGVPWAECKTDDSASTAENSLQAGADLIGGHERGEWPSEGMHGANGISKRKAMKGQDWRTRRLAILVLDDDPRRHAEFARQGRGHRIDHVWFVDDAISRLRRRRYDLVCLDNDLETEGHLREGREVAAFIASMPAEMRPRAVLIHSWNRACAREMEDTCAGSTNLASRWFGRSSGRFGWSGPGPACDGEADLRRWIDRNEVPNHLDCPRVKGPPGDEHWTAHAPCPDAELVRLGRGEGHPPRDRSHARGPRRPPRRMGGLQRVPPPARGGVAAACPTASHRSTLG